MQLNPIPMTRKALFLLLAAVVAPVVLSSSVRVPSGMPSGLGGGSSPALSFDYDADSTLYNMFYGEDSTVSVVAWFCKGDSLRYLVKEGEWNVDGKDTVMTSGASMEVLLTVLDSTARGYDMEYSFLDFGIDSTGNETRDDLMQVVLDELQKSVRGTKIGFRTDEFGRLTGYKDLGKVKRQCRHVVQNVLDSIPYFDSLKSYGLDFRAALSGVDADELVAGFTEELELLLAYHGLMFTMGRHQDHGDATETEMEYDSTVDVEVDPETLDYLITIDTDTYVPVEYVKTAMGEMFDSLLSGAPDDVRSEIDRNVDEHLVQDMVQNSYVSIRYFADGWPAEALMQVRSFFGDRGKITQKYIVWLEKSTGNN